MSNTLDDPASIPPVTQSVPVDMLTQIKLALNEAGEDLQTLLLANAGQDPRNPSVQRRLDRDLETAHRAQRLAIELGMLLHEGWA